MTHLDQIVQIIDEKGPLKGTEVVTAFMSMWNSQYCGMGMNFDPIELLGQAVQEGRIIEVEYTLPSMPYRIKSMYFPKGTQLNQIDPMVPRATKEKS